MKKKNSYIDEMNFSVPEIFDSSKPFGCLYNFFETANINKE